MVEKCWRSRMVEVRREKMVKLEGWRGTGWREKGKRGTNRDGRIQTEV